MKQPKLIKKLREIPPKERQEFLILEYCEAERELRVIEGKELLLTERQKVFKADVDAAKEYASLIKPEYEDFQGVNEYNSSILQAHASEAKRKLENEVIRRKYEMEVEKNKVDPFKKKAKEVKKQKEVLNKVANEITDLHNKLTILSKDTPMHTTKETKLEFENQHLQCQLEAEKERSKALEEKIDVLEHNKGLSDLNEQLKDNNIRLNNSLLHILYEFPIKDIIKWRKSI